MKLDPLTERFVQQHDRECAHILMRPAQKLYYLMLVASAILLFFYRWDYFLAIATFASAAFYFSIILFRLVATTLSLLGRGEVRISESEAAGLATDELPIYTILVPLYKEANVARKIIRHLNALDYPQEKLDVKLLLEEDDEQTQQAVHAAALPDNFDVIVVPHSLPKTKPKACNWGLERAKGEFLVIYDAEDRPEPDQLRKVLCAFRRQNPKTACIQAKLNYFNPRQNFLTRWFTIEYTAWFDLYLPGLVKMRVPIPLGGTSNHFKIGALREFGGWDPFNVTEDCDLGMRLFKHGYRTVIVNSTTWEEANSSVPNWIRQRSRWVKGYFQTHLAHMRHPVDTFRAVGPWGMWGFFMTVGGLSLMLVLNMVYWLFGAIYACRLVQDLMAGRDLWTILAGPRDEFRYAWKMIYYGPDESLIWSGLSIAFFAITCTLLLSNLLVIFINILACLRRNYADLMGMALLSPFYWVLISVGAWKGFIQLFTNPFYWEKTHHGLDDESANEEQAP